MNGDTLVDIDLLALCAFHAEHPDTLATVALCEMDDTSDYGNVMVDTQGRIIAFHEKQKEGKAGLANAGVYCFSPSILDHITTGKRVSIETELLPELLAGKKLILGFPFKGAFVDIGTAERLKLAQTHSLFMKTAECEEERDDCSV